MNAEKEWTSGLVLPMRAELECFPVRSDSFRRVSVPQVPQEEYEKIKSENEKLKEDREFYMGFAFGLLILMNILIAFFVGGIG